MSLSLSYQHRPVAVGVDRHRIRGDVYEYVLARAALVASDMLVICKDAISPRDLIYAREAVETGRTVLLSRSRALAPPDTDWLRAPTEAAIDAVSRQPPLPTSGGDVRVVGLDQTMLADRYDQILGSAPRADADVVVIYAPDMDEPEYRAAHIVAHSGRAVLLAREKTYLPLSTQWIDAPLQ